MTRLSVVIPSFHEEGRIGRTVERLRRELPVEGGLEIVVVDDGSKDRTLEMASDAGADQVVQLARHRGKGAAVRAGMLAARGQSRVFTDADLAYAPAQVTRFLHEVESGWDMVIGSRRHVDTKTLVRAGRIREASGRLFNLITRFVLLDQYLDTQCGLKAVAGHVAPVLFEHASVDGFAFDVELLFLARRYGLRLKEVEVELANSKTSTVRLFRDGPAMLRDLVRVRRRAALGAYDLGPEEWAALEGQPPALPR